ncbi:SWPV1-054 [Shearwaterpox virus]|uniref:3 beta-hydroxysteroid dehydrogenase/Delta 5-->4-isomerase n=1 Tax=Shearwaterpox virus TaxID=1974596 RepID=A0A1V0S7R7_CNPV|nr:SWPV1-054 [Shearwaterpox virus]
MDNKLTYVITGGCGFLGRHLVYTLIAFEKNIKEIRIYDTYIAEWVYDLSRQTNIKVVSIIGDIRNRYNLDDALQYADVVIHSAAITDVTGNTPKDTIMDVNVNGTRNVIDSCIINGVRVLVYTSSSKVIGPNCKGDPMIDGNENTNYNSVHKEAYPLSKSLAEKYILDSNGSMSSIGTRLYTCSLRPLQIYGEFCPNLEMIYKKAIKSGTVYKYTSNKAIQSRVYVGNVAWMHLLAVRDLLEKGSNSALHGDFYYCYDYSPFESYHNFNMYFMKHLGLRIKRLLLPKWTLRVIAYCNKAMKVILSPIFLYNSLLNPYTLTLKTTAFTVVTDKAFKKFGYVPLYRWEECRNRTMEWIKSI